ncbi:hypothetical protein VDGL01_06749 [Verticillium dahliae]
MKAFEEPFEPSNRPNNSRTNQSEGRSAYMQRSKRDLRGKGPKTSVEDQTPSVILLPPDLHVAGSTSHCSGLRLASCLLTTPCHLSMWHSAGLHGGQPITSAHHAS